MSCCSPTPAPWWSRRAPRRTAPIASGPGLTLRAIPGVPGIPPRPLGWLKFLHHKVGLDDDWSRSGTPDPRWDSYSYPPLVSWPRFDLIDASCALAVLADLTAAWRELYVEILDGLLRRYVTWWGALDWMTLKGRDPQRGAYPESWRGSIVPAELFGDYEAPGWTGDGMAPWGDQPDPIGADGNLFYKGFLSLLLGLRGRISGEDRWERIFAVVPDADSGGWTYSHRTVNETLEGQWARRPAGCHCENTKIWPNCLSAAGLGLLLRDGNAGGESHWVFDQWFIEAERRYLRHVGDGTVAGSVLYHDPIADVSMPGLPPADLSLAFYMGPQRPDVTRQVWSAQVDAIGWRQPDRPVAHIPHEPKFVSLGRVLARELGDAAATARLDAFAEDLEPTWTDGAFVFGFGLEEEHPRGQPNAMMMLAEALDRPGRWAEAIRPINDGRFDQPSVSGVDFPVLGLHQAVFDPDSETLCVSTHAASPTDGATTAFKVTGLHDAHRWRVFDDDRDYSRTRVVDNETLEVTCSVAEHHFAIRGEGASS
jgi:hypothetical protein